MPEDLGDALAAVRPLLLDGQTLVRAVAAGRRRGASPAWPRVELRPVDLKTGRHLQVVTADERGPVTANHPFGEPAATVVDGLLAEPFGNWHVQSTTETVQLRVTKKGQAQLHRRPTGAVQTTGHDLAAAHLIDPGDPLFATLGAGASKRRQVDAFLRVLRSAVDEADLPTDRPLHVVDLGCGNAYLSFAAYRFLAADRDVRLTGVDQRPQSRTRNSELAADLGWADSVSFVEGSILGAPVGPPVDIVLALHACDTATDDALAQALLWRAPVVLTSPCCHHDLQRQLREVGTPPPYGLVTRHPILRERLGDVLTDALRAALLRMAGYRVEAVQFVSAEYTPRNTMLRAVRLGDGVPVDDAVRAEYEELVGAWGITPYLQRLLDDARG